MRVTEREKKDGWRQIRIANPKDRSPVQLFDALQALIEAEARLMDFVPFDKVDRIERDKAVAAALNGAQAPASFDEIAAKAQPLHFLTSTFLDAIEHKMTWSSEESD